MDELLALASCQPTALSLAAMYRYAPKRGAKGDHRGNNGGGGGGNKFVDVDRLRNAQFLHRELPIRIAQRAVDLLTLPHGLNRTREVQSIANTYLNYLQTLRGIPLPTNGESERKFTEQLNEFILDRHSIPMAISRGLRSLSDERKAPVDGRRLSEMEEALNRFFTARVGLRFLVEHHVLSGRGENSDDLYRKQLEAEGAAFLADHLRGGEDCESPEEEASCGAIQRDCDPVKEVRRTVARVAQLCRESYGISPEIEIVVATPERGEGVSFTYVPHHLRYMLAELLKNSCRATVRR
jgi:pyruvate dehydrogenase kinase 2/3/4